MAEPGPRLGEVLELEIGAVAHGGHCVARVGDAPGARVVFVRHALPGERARVLVTEDAGGSFCRGDAVEILRASPDRRLAPCPHAGPGRCGGCDWQHADWPAQRRLKAQVVREQFARLAGMDVQVEVEALEGGPLGWRTRTSYGVDPDGRVGLRRHRSHELEVLTNCPLGSAGVGDHPILAAGCRGVAAVEIARGDDPEAAVLAHTPRPQRGRQRPADRVELIAGPSQLHHRIDGHDFVVSSGGFWQVHPRAASTFVAAIIEAAQPRLGDRVVDLYAGAGLFTVALAKRVGQLGRVVGVESARQAVADAAANLAGLPWAEVRQATVRPPTMGELGLKPDIVVLDPPRSGAGRAVMTAIAAAGPRVIVYLSCDPASLARDAAGLLADGWRLERLRAFDAFPMTAHIECLAVFRAPGR